MEKKEKNLYLPKTTPQKLDIPELQYLTIKGTGSPQGDHFAACFNALYSVSYAVKLTPKKGEIIPHGYYDYTVNPIEGVWDSNDEAKKNFTGHINKEDFIYKIMIRQTDFVDDHYFDQMIKFTKKEAASIT